MLAFAINSFCKVLVVHLSKYAQLARSLLLTAVNPFSKFTQCGTEIISFVMRHSIIYPMGNRVSSKVFTISRMTSSFYVISKQFYNVISTLDYYEH